MLGRSYILALGSVLKQILMTGMITRLMICLGMKDKDE